MAGEDQERFEDYLELEQYLSELQAGHVAHPPTELTPDQARVYRMAALFRSADPEAAEPRPEFVASLQASLEQELRTPRKRRIFPFLSKKQQKTRPVSRRAVLAGGAAVAASLVLGAGIEHTIEQAVSSTAQGVPTQYANVLPGETWYLVTSLAELGDNAVRFATDTIVGYVIRGDEDGDDSDNGKIIAMSAACTHMGCIVQWNGGDHKFHCPCHGGLFSEYGKVDKGASPIRYLTPLPRLETMVENGNVYVKVPVKK